MFTVRTSHACKPVIQDATFKKFLNHVINHRTPVTEVLAVFAGIDSLELIEICVHKLIERGVGHTAGTVEIGRLG